MTNQLKIPCQVYFLGAGASVLAGAPTFDNFHKKAENICKYNLSDNTQKEIFQRVLKYWKMYFNDYNIEDYYTAIEMREMLKHDSDFVSTDDIVTVICSTIQKSLTSNKSSFYYENLLNNSEDYVVITTNWDIILESSHLEDGRINYESVNTYNPPSYKSAEDYGFCQYKDIHILKLHGSLNWGFCEKCGKIYYFDKKIYDLLISGEGVVCKDHKIRLIPVIVPPTLSKLVKAEPKTNPQTSPYFQLVSIWKKAFETLSLCEKVYFIGYSFPETDVQMKVFISNALRENYNLKEVIIVSNHKHGYSKVNFEERYLSIISRAASHPKIEFFYDGFEGFYKEKLIGYGPRRLL